MADFTLPKPIISGINREKSRSKSNIAYAAFILFSFWIGSQLLSVLIHSPDIFEHFMQIQQNTRPRVEMGFAVGTVFGLIPFIAGCLLLGMVALWLKIRRPH